MSKKLEELTKLNFWDAMKTLYPKSMTYFNLWIDDYKKDNDWENLFNDDDRDPLHHVEAPKFHDLPFAMQFGIFTQYLADQGSDTDNLVRDFKEIAMDCFKEMERVL